MQIQKERRRRCFTGCMSEHGLCSCIPSPGLWHVKKFGQDSNVHILWSTGSYISFGQSCLDSKGKYERRLVNLEAERDLGTFLPFEGERSLRFAALVRPRYIAIASGRSRPISHVTEGRGGYSVPLHKSYHPPPQQLAGKNSRENSALDMEAVEEEEKEEVRGRGKGKVTSWKMPLREPRF